MNDQPTGTPDPAAHPDPNETPLRVSTRDKIIGAVIALLAVAGLGWLAWHLTHPDTPSGSSAGGPGGGRQGGGGGGGGPGGPGGPGGRSPAVTVGVATAERAEIPVVLEALGTVTPQATARVRAQVTGVLQQVLYQEGQVVKQGQVLAIIDPRQFEMSLQQATGQRLKDEAQLQAARVTLQRYRTLLQQDSIARQDVDTQEALVKQLEAAIVVDKANEGTARLNLGYTRITAPISGRVGLRQVDVGNVTSPSDANGVAIITQLQPIDVQFSLPQDSAQMLQQNAGSRMEATALDRTRMNVLDTGVFASLDNQIDTTTGTVKGKARFSNAKGALFPSQFVNVRLNVQTIRDAVVIPVSALRHGNSSDYVFVLQDDRTVQQRNVRSGQATVDKVQVVTGLKTGERVITEGADRLRDGSRVLLPGDSPRGQGGAGGGRGEGGQRRQGASAPAEASSAAPPAANAGRGASRDRGASAVPGNGAPAPRTDTSGGETAAAPPAAAPLSDKPTAEQRQRMLDSAQGDAEQLDRRKKFLEALDRGDPQAIERWHQMQQRRRQGQ